MAEFKEVIKQFNRMCVAQEACDKCAINEKRGLLTCWGALTARPDEMEEFVMQWAKEHPPITNRDKFKEVFGFDPLTHRLYVREWLEESYKEPKDD